MFQVLQALQMAMWYGGACYKVWEYGHFAGGCHFAMALSAEVAEVGHGRSLHMPLPPVGKACEPDAA